MLETSDKRHRKTRVRRTPRSTFRAKPPKKISRKWLLLPLCLVLILAAAIWIIADNHRVAVRHVTVAHAQIPAEFDGFRILMISDLRGQKFGSGNRRLIDAVNSQQYDLLLLCGDYLGDGGDPDDLQLVSDLLTHRENRDAPVYYILGENDYQPILADGQTLSDGWNRCIVPDEPNDVMQYLENLGATFVYPIQEIRRGDARIFLTGIAYREALFDTYQFDSDKDFTVCVTHKPIDYDVDRRLESINRVSFREVDFDLVLSGHTLSGQYRLPLLGTLYMKEYGLFPQETYAYGLHEAQGRYSYITSGLGVKSGFRLFNTPEIAVIELRTL